MKKTVSIALIFLLAAAMTVFGGCKLFNKGGDPSQIDIPTPEPTAEPTEVSAEVLDSFIGDWYGVYSVPEARGIYALNAYVKNDCAMRVSLDGFGAGSCYLQVNGLGRDAISGSSNVFALCNAKIAQGKLVLEGMINRAAVEWTFELVDGELKLSEVYGDVEDHMRIEITLVRPDALASSGLTTDAFGYILDRGFAGIIDKLGGSTSELPVVTAPEGMDPHLFFDGEVEETPAPVYENYITSADGNIKVSLPEGYTVTSNNFMDFELACPQDRVRSIEFTVSAWNTDGLSFLLGNTPNVTELYHYTIDGYDFYGTFLDSEFTEPGTRVFKLCGTNGTGALVIINITLEMDEYSAYSYVNVDNAAFTQIVLGARFTID